MDMTTEIPLENQGENHSKIKGVYLISPSTLSPKQEEQEKFLLLLENILLEGIGIFQWRIKDGLNDRDQLFLAKQIRQITKRTQTLFFVNDRVDLALLSEADGLHLGPGDFPLRDIKKIWGRDKLLGLSNHTMEDVLSHVADDDASLVTYHSLGPLYATTSKKQPDMVLGYPLFERVLPYLHRPVVAIGGITLERLPRVLQTGVEAVGVISDIWHAQDPVLQAKKWVTSFRELKGEANR